MRKGIYIGIVCLVFWLAAVSSRLAFDAMERIVLGDAVAVPLLGCTFDIDIHRFEPYYILALAVIPITFIIIRNNRRAVVLVVASLTAAGIALLGFRYSQPRMESLHLEVVPLISLLVTVSGTVVLKLTGKKSSLQSNETHNQRMHQTPENRT